MIAWRSYLRIAALLALPSEAFASLPPVAGTYEHTGSIAATLEVAVHDGIADIRLDGGGDRNAGAASAGDCAVRASGPVRTETVTAGFRAVQTDAIDYDAESARAEHRQVRIRFTKDGATVLAADTDGYCGIGASFLGYYRRR